jgi:hypothetical protein
MNLEKVAAAVKRLFCHRVRYEVADSGMCQTVCHCGKKSEKFGFPVKVNSTACSECTHYRGDNVRRRIVYCAGKVVK